MEYTVIILGRLEYANERSIQQAIKAVNRQQETRYKGEVLFKDLTIFNEERQVLIVPRLKATAIEKVWLNTLHLLEQATQYAIAGELKLFKIANSVLEERQCLQPKGDKTAIMSYEAGKQLLAEGSFDQAIAAFTEAIDSFPGHAQAYERRANAHLQKGETDQAWKDYAKSIELDDKRGEAYLGRGILASHCQDWLAAKTDFEDAKKHSMPHDDTYLEALHRLGRVQYELKAYDEALKSFDFFLTRPLKSDHSQFPFRRAVTFDKGRVLLAKGMADKALACFDEAANMPPRNGKPDTNEILVHRAMAFEQLEKAGKKV